MRDETADVYARLHNRVDEILHYVWDPIGVAGIPEARDEYDGYIAHAVKMLFENAGPDEMAQYLHSIESEAMGLTRPEGCSNQTRRAAEMLVNNCRWVRRTDELRKKA